LYEFNSFNKPVFIKNKFTIYMSSYLAEGLWFYLGTNTKHLPPSVIFNWPNRLKNTFYSQQNVQHSSICFIVWLKIFIKARLRNKFWQTYINKVRVRFLELTNTGACSGNMVVTTTGFEPLAPGFKGRHLYH
jgi:hypothetical protein